MEKKYIKTLFIIIGILILLLIFGIYITSLGWITVGQLIIWFILIPIAVPGFIIALIYIIKNWKSKKKEDEDIFKRAEKVDSTSVEPWVKKFLKEKYCDDIEIEHNEYMSIGKKGEVTPMIYLNGRGRTTNFFWHILVNLIEPDKRHTMVHGDYVREDIERMAEALSYIPPKKAKEVIKITFPDGTTREINRDLFESENLVIQPKNEGLKEKGGK